MAHYVITLGGTDYQAKGYSEQDAIESAYDQADSSKKVTPPAIPVWWLRCDDMPVDAIRPATVREAMASEYGDDWASEGASYTYEIAKRTWFTYQTDGEPYASGYQPLTQVWHEAEVLVINHAMANDRHGYDDAVNVSNYRVLSESWKALKGLSRGPWSNVDVIALDLDSEAPADLTDVLDGLENYPVIDEQEWSNVEEEIIQEHWEEYGKSDVVSAVEKALGADSLTDAAEAIITRLVWDGLLYLGNGGEYPSMLDYSACEFGYEAGYEAVAGFFTEHIGTVVTLPGRWDGEEATVFDLTRENIIAE